MKNLRFVLLLLFLSAGNLSAGESRFSLLTEATPDSVRLGIGYSPVRFVNFDLTFGPAWEYADLRMNDWTGAVAVSFIFFSDARFRPYVLTAGQLYLVKIPEKTIAAPAFVLAGGVNWAVGKKRRHIIFLEAGWHWGARDVLLEDGDSYIHVEYVDRWKPVPGFHAALGYRFVF